jgi:hypothetical protein
VTPNLSGEQHTGQKVWRTIGHQKVLPQRQNAGHLRLDGLLTIDPTIEMGLVRKSPGPRPEEGTTASRRRMLTAPTPLFSAPVRRSAILVEPLFDPIEPGARHASYVASFDPVTFLVLYAAHGGERGEALYRAGFPVAGHDPGRERSR